MFCRLFKCLIAVFLVSTSIVSIESDDQIESLPFCGPSSGSNYKSKKLMFVSTLDGQVSMLNIADGGTKEWSVSTGPGPMLESNIHKLELTNNGQWVRMIPSLAGGLYKFNGEFIEAIPVNAEHLLKASFRYSDDLVISGGKESRTYGVEVDSGRVLYECTMESCNNITDEVDDEIGDVVLVQRMTQTIRAVEPRTGTERWNFSVAQHDMKFSPNPSADCHYVNDPSSEVMLKVIVPEGLICALSKSQPNKVLWTHKFESPVVSAWRLDEGQLIWVDLFGGKTPPLLQSAAGEDSMPDSPALYVGMHKKQLYIQESVKMQTLLQTVSSQYKQHLIGADKAFPRIPWQPIPAIASALELKRLLPGQKDLLQITDESSSQALATTTANSVLYGSEYVNGNGFYLYTPETAKKIRTGLCHPEDEQNITITTPTPEEEFNKEFEEADTSVQVIMVSLSYYWREVCVISISTAIVLNLLIHHRALAPFLRTIKEIAYALKALVLYTIFGVRNLREFQTKVLEVEISQDGDSTNISKQQPMASDYTSRYLTDFDPVHCLGKGGFGVVFEAKNKIDDCHYAVKRIPLPSREDARERVMREVKALAKLDHKNIVRYFNAWQECPPPGWQEAQDKYWKEKSSSKNKNAFEDVITIDPLTPDEPPSTAELLSKNMNSSLHSNCKLNKWGKSYNNADISDSYIVFEASHLCCTDSAGNQLKSVDSHQDSVIPISVTSDYSDQSYSNYDCFEKSSKCRAKPKRPNSLLLKSEDSATDNSKQVNLRMFLFIQMQLCRKDSLREWLRDINRPTDVNLAINIFEQIVQAVEYVHLKGLIHRDLKPSNIFFSLDGQIKVGDFGLVTAMVESGEQFVPQDRSPSNTNSNTSLSSREKHTARVGTHLYMSPEQVLGKPYSYKVDIYSLGLILFELLVPFSTEMERAQTLQDLRKNKFPSHFQTNFYQEYQLLSLMLSHRPEERPTTYGIRAKPPLQKTPPTIDDDVTWHFDLPLRRKTSSNNSNSFDS